MLFGFLFKAIVLFVAVSAATVMETPGLVSVLKISNTTQFDNVCIITYNLEEEFKDLPLPSWLSDWKTLMFNTFCDDRYDIKIDERFSEEEKAKSLLFSLASGYRVDMWHDDDVLQKRFPNHLSSMKEDLWKTGMLTHDKRRLQNVVLPRETGSPDALEKRTISGFAEPHWIYDTHNQARVEVLRELQSSLEEKKGADMVLPGSALCKSRDHFFACLSWSGGSKVINSAIAASAIDSGISGNSNPDLISCTSPNTFQEVKLYRVCLSNRAEDCR